MAVLEVRLLGPIELVVDGQVIPLTAAKLRALLALLALEAGTPVDADVLADRLWQGNPPATAGSVLRTYISQLRRALPAERLERAGTGYVLHLEPNELDSRRLELAAAHATAHAAAPAQVVIVLQEVLSLWRGQPLRELGDDGRSVAEAARLECCRLAALETWADASLEVGQHDSVATALASVVHDQPLHERLVGRLMLALYRCGRQAEALAAYERLRRVLLDELGLDPAPDVQRLQARILEQDPALDPPQRELGNLPSSVTSFVGREQQVQRLVELLESHRLVTLTGAGGSGKSRLALETARTFDVPVDGAWFVELAGRSEATEVAAAVLATLGVAQQSEEEPLATLMSTLARRRLLLVLDNCEHVSRACSELAISLLRHAPGVTVIATSRAPLGSAGEVVFPVPPLPVPDLDAGQAQVAGSPAAQLLTQRIASARGGRSPEPDEWPALASLCRRLDGLPLALELVAARAGTLSLADVDDTVGMQLMTAELEPVGPDHHRSLVACVDWSLAMLDDQHREVLQRVCLLPGLFSAEAAAALRTGADVPTTIRQLMHLSRHSLLEPLTTGLTRFRVLEPVRQVVLASLDEGRRQEALDGLAAWCAAWAEEIEPSLRGPDVARCLDHLEADVHALRVALDHALSKPDPTDGVRIAAAVSGLWAYRGYLLEGQRWLSRALSMSDRVPAALHMRLLLAAGTHAVTLGDVDTFRHHTGAALELARAAADGPGVLRVLLWAGRAVLLHDEHEAAAQLYDEALAAATSAGDESARASALAGLGDVADARGDLDAAAAFHLQSLAAFRDAADPHGEGQALLNVAETDRRAERLSDAEARFSAAARVFERIADRSCAAASAEGLGRVARDGGRLDDAEQYYRRAVAVRRELQQERVLAGTLTELAVVLAEAGRPLEAVATLGAAGEDKHPLSGRLRSALGTTAYLSAWADGRASSAP